MPFTPLRNESYARFVLEELGATDPASSSSSGITPESNAVYDSMALCVRLHRNAGWFAGIAGLSLGCVATTVLRTRHHGTYKIELGYDFLLVFALISAVTLIFLLRRLLAGVENLSSSSPPIERTYAPDPAASTSETTRMAFYQWLGFLTGFALFILFCGTHTGWASMTVTPLVLGLAIFAGGCGSASTTAIFSRELHVRRRLGDSVGTNAWLRWSRPSVTVIEKAFTITGIVFALYSGKLATVALNRTALANIANARGQLYQSEARLSAAEGERVELSGLYTRVETAASESDLSLPVSSPKWVGYAREYWNRRLLATLAPIEDEVARLAARDPDARLLSDLPPAAIAGTSNPAERLVACRQAAHTEILEIVRTCQDATQLYNFVFPNEDVVREQSYVQKRCRAALLMAMNHIVEIMDTMHSAFDYSQEEILRRNEYDTWVGYLTDIGAHPLLIVNFQNWIEQKYMSRQFFADVSQRFETHDEQGATAGDRLAHRIEYEVWRHYLIDDIQNFGEEVGKLRTYKTRPFGTAIDPAEPALPVPSKKTQSSK